MSEFNFKSPRLFSEAQVWIVNNKAHLRILSLNPATNHACKLWFKTQDNGFEYLGNGASDEMEAAFQGFIATTEEEK